MAEQTPNFEPNEAPAFGDQPAPAGGVVVYTDESNQLETAGELRERGVAIPESIPDNQVPTRYDADTPGAPGSVIVVTDPAPEDIPEDGTRSLNVTTVTDTEGATSEDVAEAAQTDADEVSAKAVEGSPENKAVTGARKTTRTSKKSSS